MKWRFILRFIHLISASGFVIGQKNRVSQRNNGSFPITIFSQRTEVLEFLNGFDSCNLDLSMFYIYAKQGKSAKQQMWSLKALSASNANLIEVSPDRDCSLYEIPKEGINLTLCCQSVLLYPKQHSLSWWNQSIQSFCCYFSFADHVFFIKMKCSCSLWPVCTTRWREHFLIMSSVTLCFELPYFLE